uniref:JmjC domain-containing protein n=1 Tax=Haptolina brevifila TaxID=156173 RepID=A0A7S2IMA6_9EUKA
MLTGSELLSERRWLLVGGPGSGSRWHQDPFATSAWNACLHGRRLWCFMPPSEGCYPPGVCELDEGGARHAAALDAPPSAEWFAKYGGGDLGERREHLLDAGGAPLRWVEQVAGDVVWVPKGWWHTTLNLEESVALTQNQLLPKDAAGALREMAAQPRQQVRTQQGLRAVLRERHSDD